MFHYYLVILVILVILGFVVGSWELSLVCRYSLTFTNLIIDAVIP